MATISLWSQDGEAALAAASARTFNLMIVDRMLPGMDGLSVIENLRERGVTTPVLVLSALGAVNDRVRGLKAGGRRLPDQTLCHGGARCPR